MNKPTEKPSATRPPESSHKPAKTSSEECSQAPKAKRDLEERQPRCRRAKHVKITTAIEDAPGRIVTKTAKCADYPQPCLHYNSIINSNPNADYHQNPCPYKKKDSDPELAAKRNYYAEHPKHLGANDWWAKIPPVAGAKDCEADEWPPARLYYLNDGYDTLQGNGPRNINKRQFIRLMDGSQNGLAGSLWRGCPRIASINDINTVITTIPGPDGTETVSTRMKALYTRTTMQIEFERLVQPDNDDGLQVNVCQPQQQGVDHRGFALLNDDPWYDRNPNAKQLQAAYLGNPNFKRSWIDPDQIAVMEANSSKMMTDEERKNDFESIRCARDGCEGEWADLPSDAAVVHAPPPNLPVQAPASASTLSVAPALVNHKAHVTLRKGVASADYPRRTQGTEYM